MKNLIKSKLRAFSSLVYQGKNIIRPPQKIILLHAGRCGSTVLSSHFEADPRLFWEGEAIQFYYRRNQKKGTRFAFDDNPLGFLLDLAKKSPKLYHGVEVKSLENMDFSLENMPKTYDEFKDWALSNNYKLILLYRDNILRQVLSALIAFQFDLWHKDRKNKKDVLNKKISINLNKVFENHEYSLIQYLDLFYSFNEFCKSQNDQNILVLNFEKDILQESFMGYAKSMSFLGLDKLQSSTSHKRVNPEKISELVENYDELKNYLKNTKYASLLIE